MNPTYPTPASAVKCSRTTPYQCSFLLLVKLATQTTYYYYYIIIIIIILLLLLLLLYYYYCYYCYYYYYCYYCYYCCCCYYYCYYYYYYNIIYIYIFNGEHPGFRFRFSLLPVKPSPSVGPGCCSPCLSSGLKDRTGWGQSWRPAEPGTSLEPPGTALVQVVQEHRIGAKR